MSNSFSPPENVKYYAGAFSEHDERVKYTRYHRTQHAKHVRLGFMGLGALVFLGAGALSADVILRQLENDRQIISVQVLSQQIEPYHAEIEAELAKANDLAAEIGNKVADPAVATQFASLRTSAQAVLDTAPPRPEIGDKPKQVQIDREVVEGIIAVNSGLVEDLQTAEARVEASHAAYLLQQSRGPARAAAEALKQPIAIGEAVMAASDGIVSESERAELQKALERGNAAIEQANREYRTAEEFDAAKAECDEAKSKVIWRSKKVFNLIPIYPEYVLDEEGNAIPNPDYRPPVTIPGLSDKKDAAEAPVTG